MDMLAAKPDESEMLLLPSIKRQGGTKDYHKIFAGVDGQGKARHQKSLQQIADAGGSYDF